MRKFELSIHKGGKVNGTLELSAVVGIFVLIFSCDSSLGVLEINH
jgi:hypothetical protein